MKLSTLKNKTSRMTSFYMTPLLIAIAFNFSLSACGHMDQGAMESQSLPENNGPPCTKVDWNHFSVVNVGSTLDVSVPNGMTVRTAVVMGRQETLPAQLADTTTLEFNVEGVHTVFAVTEGIECSPTVTRRIVDVVYEFPITTGIDKEDARIQAWASSWAMPVSYGESVVEMWQTPERAMGPASGQPADVVSLGEGGQIELLFDGEIYNGDGADFAVFENSFSPTFLELGFVEVSSDGVHFLQFPTIYLGTNAIDPYGDHAPEIMYGFAGRFPKGVGTPFDLQDLRFDPDVESGLIDLDRITSVRITDVIGDGSRLDDMGRPIFDPYPTTGSAGFDLDAVGVIHFNETQQPSDTEASR